MPATSFTDVLTTFVRPSHRTAATKGGYTVWLTTMTPLEHKEKMVLLAAFDAAYPDAPKPMTSDMLPLIMDTGASISICQFKNNFTTPIRPVQNITIKGIAAGLQVAGVRDLSYDFINDSGIQQTLLLKDCLYVPQSPVRLNCPHQNRCYQTT